MDLVVPPLEIEELSPSWPLEPLLPSPSPSLPPPSLPPPPPSLSPPPEPSPPLLSPPPLSPPPLSPALIFRMLDLGTRKPSPETPVELPDVLFRDNATKMYGAAN
ncbi:hypothetical protein B0H14DRAFT_3486125 [Mycena olivaceomarginata]|nr:hypothetical protein B0H14DRAFT_3486125 [Mycena olivaceomarginata]